MKNRFNLHDSPKMKATTAAALLVVILFVLYISGYAGEKQAGMRQAATGKAVSSVYAQDVFANVTCNSPLNRSWNLISSPCMETNTSISYSMRSVASNFISIHAYNGSEQLDRWKSYNPNIDSFAVQDLNAFSTERGYWINLNGSVNLTLTGTIILPNFIQLKKGWNLIGWTSNETKNVSIALNSIAGLYTSVHAYFANDSADPWKVYNPNLDPSLSDLKVVQPYYGYWLNMTANTTLKVI